MPNYTAVGRNGVTVTKDVGLAEVWFEQGSQTVEAHTEGVGAPKVLNATTDVGKVLTNEGAAAKTYITLPTAVAGLWYQFFIQNVNGMRVMASAGDTIRVGNTASIAAGYIESTAIGAALFLVAINATEWVAMPADLNWQVQTS